jgi:small subunit ribosomal protein S25
MSVLDCVTFHFRHILAAELNALQKKNNPANFGFGCDRQCICEVLGQVPCPGLVPLPKQMRGKYKYQKD